MSEIDALYRIIDGLINRNEELRNKLFQKELEERRR